MTFKQTISFVLSALLCLNVLPVAAKEDTSFYESCAALEEQYPADQQNRLLVRAEALPSLSVKPLSVLRQEDYFVLQFESTDLASQAYLELLADDQVDLVEFDQPVVMDEPNPVFLQAEESQQPDDSSQEKPDQTPETPWWITSLGIDTYKQRLLSSTRSVTVAVIDTGIVTSDPYFAGRTLPGYDFVNNDDNPDSQGDNHGSLVSAIILKATEGLNVKVLPLRALPGAMSQVINAIRYATEKGADVINMSLAYYTHSDIMHHEIQTALNSGAVVVAAAGNANVDMDEQNAEPAHMRGIITVGSCERDFTRSNWGRGYIPCYGEAMDVVAYGTGIVVEELQSGYVGYGTSFSCPIIASMAALLKIQYPSITSMEVENFLKTQAVDIGEPGFDVIFGFGIPYLSSSPAIASDFQLAVDHLSLAEGESIQLESWTLPFGSVGADLSWSSSDPEVASVWRGFIDAHKEGSAIITARMANGTSHSAVVEVFKPSPLTRLPYQDIASLDDGMLEAIEWCYNMQIMTGLDPETFGPYHSLNRAQLATVLYRINGSPNVSDQQNPFDDVPDDAYFTQAAKWAHNQSVFLGYGDGRLGPSDPVTREQLALVLKRLSARGLISASSDKPEQEISGDPLAGYSDADRISSDDMRQGLEWAIAHGYLETDDRNLDPSGDALRKTIALALYRYEMDH